MTTPSPSLQVSSASLASAGIERPTAAPAVAGAPLSSATSRNDSALSSASEPLRSTRWARGLAAEVLQLMHLMRRRWYVFVPVLLIWALAYTRLFIDPTPRLPLLFNWTPSLPYRVALVRYGPHELRQGDLVVFAFDGEAKSRYPGLRGQPFFKRVRGMPGDVISVRTREVFVNGQAVGLAKTHAHDHCPLTPITPMVIPAGHYYVQGTNPDSFDSRYRESGLVRADQVIAVVKPLI
jgi:conjugal transfer pilin signal peptidase TrbI